MLLAIFLNFPEEEIKARRDEELISHLEIKRRSWKKENSSENKKNYSKKCTKSLLKMSALKTQQNRPRTTKQLGVPVARCSIPRLAGCSRMKELNHPTV